MDSNFNEVFICRIIVGNECFFDMVLVIGVVEVLNEF